jgi:hypothetical protein
MNANAHWMHGTTFSAAHVNVVLRHSRSPFATPTVAYRRAVVNRSRTRIDRRMTAGGWTTKDQLTQLDIPAEKLDGGLAHLFGIVVGVSGHGQGADGRQESPEPAARDTVGQFNPDALQDILSRP